MEVVEVEGVVADSMEPSVLGELRQSQPHHSKVLTTGRGGREGPRPDSFL